MKRFIIYFFTLFIGCLVGSLIISLDDYFRYGVFNFIEEDFWYAYKFSIKGAMIWFFLAKVLSSSEVKPNKAINKNKKKL